MITRTHALLDRILQMDDPVERNRLITLCYRDLGEHLAAHLGRRDLTWFVFGAWASGTAGAVIRGEGLPLDLGTSGNVAAGNVAIIGDVAPPFLAWLGEIERDGSPTPAALERTLAHPALVDAPALGEALRCYHAAAELHAAGADADDTALAQLILLGNLLVGEHEQQIVDRFIDAAMPLGGVFGLVTTRFVHIETPDGPVDVCRDLLAPRYIAPAIFPAVLAELTHPGLVSACGRYGQAVGGDVSASNVLLWEDYADRMGFILTFFRAYQRDDRFFTVPAGYLPADALPR